MRYPLFQKIYNNLVHVVRNDLHLFSTLMKYFFTTFSNVNPKRIQSLILYITGPDVVFYASTINEVHL